MDGFGLLFICGIKLWVDNVILVGIGFKFFFLRNFMGFF